MRSLLIIISTLIFISCKRSAVLSVKYNNGNRIIAIQPLGAFDEKQLSPLEDQLRNFYNCRVIILKPVEIPPHYRIPGEEGFLADSLLQFLNKQLNDPVVEVIGLTHQEIYIIKDGYYDKIIGLGYISKGSCVISDQTLITTDSALWNNRLRKAVFHELGHNLGLVHCKVEDCLMSEENEKIFVLNKKGGDYCARCRQKLE